MKDYDEILFTVYGDPQALKRHRTFRTKKGININVDPSKSDKSTFLWKAISDNKPKKPFNDALRVKLVFYMPRPKSHYRTGKNAGKLKESAPIFHIKKPDIDNLVKFVLDALAGVYWKDDTIISTLITRKVYANDVPKTTISIKQDYFN